jgi:Universal stress protein family
LRSVRHDVGFGVPYEKIVEKAAEENADLIVMSTHGWSGLFHALIGSVTEKVVRLASCPVLSIRPLEESVAAESPCRDGIYSAPKPFEFSSRNFAGRKRIAAPRGGR